MADIILKDKDGVPQPYTNVNSVTFNTTTPGETATFIAQKQVDWNQTDTTAVDYIKNKPQDLATKDFVESHVQEKIDAIEIPEDVATKEYVQGYVQEQISNIEIPDTQVQADWNQTDTDAVDYIKNKPQDIATESYVESYVQEKIDAIEIPDIADQVQANWEENDEASKAYVQNRPFYVDHYIVPQTTLQFEKSSYNNNYKSSSLAGVITENGIEGKKYVVEWDGVEYVTMCRMVTFNTPGNVFGESVETHRLIGNSILWNSDVATSAEQDTGEPFVLRLIAEQNGTLNTAFHIDLDCIVTSDEGTSHTIRICCVDNVVKIGAKYLPDGIATDDSVREQIANIEIPDVPEQEQADWNVTDASSKAFIQNKPEIPSIEGLATEDFVKEQIAAIEIPEGGGSIGGGASNEKVFLEETEIENLFNLDGLIGAQIPFTDYLNIGETYYVNWNGVEYEVTNAQDATALMQNLIDPRITKAVAMGNGETFGLGGNNEPFIIVTTDEVIMFADLSPEAAIGGKNIVRIYQKTPLTVSWENVTDKPFGEETVTIFEGTFQDTLVDNDGDGVNEAWNGVVILEDTSDATLVIGQDYTVTFDGVAYELTCCLLGGLPCVGNPVLDGGTDNGVPFAIARDENDARGMGQVWAAILVSTPTDITISGAYDVKITGTVTKHLDNKYLDILENGGDELIPETTMGLTYESSGSVWAGSTQTMTEAAYNALYSKAGEQVSVMFDGVEYLCNITLDSSTILLGNISIHPASTAEDTSEPFLFMIGRTEEEGSYKYVWSILTNDPAPSDASATIEHTVSVVLNPGYKIKEEYLPILEAFGGNETDLLTEQDVGGFADQDGSGLYSVTISPAIVPAVEGETYSIRWDGVLYSDLYCSIVNIGNVNYYVVGNIGLAGGDDTGEPFAIACVYVGDDAVNAFFSNDTLDTHKVGVFQKEPTVCTIKESYIPDSVKLPTATADDNNKFLRIVDGVPAWVSLTDVSIEGA